MRKRDQRDADDEDQSAQGHHRLAAQPVRKYSRKDGRDDAAQQHSGHNHRKLSCIEARRRLEIRQRPANDSDVHPIEQATESCHAHQQEIIAALPG